MKKIWSSKTKENKRPWQQMILSYIVKPKLQHTSKYTGLLCFSKSSYTNRETDKSDTFLLAFRSLSSEGTKGAEVTQLYYQHLWDLEKLFVLHVLRLCIFSCGPIGVTLANIICKIFALLKPLWLWIVRSNAFGMTFNISLRIKIVKMQVLLLARRAQAHVQ